MTPIVQALEAERLVARSVGHRDKRTTMLYATDTGRDVLDAGRRRRVKELALLFNGCSKKDLHTLERAAGLIERTLAQAERTP
jgi:DNA-binding MarR family transcriptional regulator